MSVMIRYVMSVINKVCDVIDDKVCDEVIDKYGISCKTVHGAAITTVTRVLPTPPHSQTSTQSSQTRDSPVHKAGTVAYQTSYSSSCEQPPGC